MNLFIFCLIWKRTDVHLSKSGFWPLFLGIGSTRNKYLITSLRLSRLRFRISRIGQGFDWRTFLREPMSKIRQNHRLEQMDIRPVQDQAKSNCVDWSADSYICECITTLLVSWGPWQLDRQTPTLIWHQASAHQKQKS